ncbi:hypothetical protein KR018_007529 [Drosophila ironensis]|nr:hypothetical protein KR018_007529 [Drosophila ironensis]
MTDIYPLADKIDRYLHRLRDNAVEHFAECNKDELWGFSIGRPCFFVKLNNVMGFRPVTYDTPNDLKPTDPPSLADTIRKYGGAPKIWLDCKLDDGTYPKIEYIPGPYYAVSKNMKGVQRVVAVQLSEMPINRDVFVVCSAWARNIVIDREYNGRGHVRFALNMRQNTEKPNVDPVGGGGAGPVVRAGEGAGAAPDSAPDYYAGAAPDSSSNSGAGAAPDSEPVSGAGAAPDSAPYSDAGAAPDSAPDSGAGAAPDSSPDSGAGAAPDSEPDSGAGAAPDSGTGAAPDSEPNSAPYSDAEADPDSAPDSGAGAVPESDLRKQDMKQDMYYIPQIDKNLEPPEMSVVLPPAPELEPPENGKRKPLEPPTEPPSF